ncbi:MAG: prepilin-type N-terminal cleavage/methylation domain-containing protein [Candidatus Sumerlaeota bacterium]|nr:prepilin-type N-terminal cleavage/methylation domain-containing protein [Candidatus Sumerlaeota bacterium]
MKRRRGFTLIELLIVVAIIAILAAIAVPNFLEAQVRSKVSRCAADMRSIRTGLESYAIDNSKYPETDTGEANLTKPGVGMFRTTTPVAYLSSVPKSPFDETQVGNPGSPKNCNRLGIYLYVRAQIPVGVSGVQDANNNGIDDDYEADRIAYIAQNGSLAINMAVRATGQWEVKSVGPNNVDDRHTIGLSARIYDPTNGTVSAGDMVIYSDSQGFAQTR